MIQTNLVSLNGESIMLMHDEVVEIPWGLYLGIGAVVVVGGIGIYLVARKNQGQQ